MNKEEAAKAELVGEVIAQMRHRLAEEQAEVAQTFARHPVGRPLYDRYRQRGLSATATYVILARKILRLAHALVSQGTTFDPQRFAAACAGT